MRRKISKSRMKVKKAASTTRPPEAARSRPKPQAANEFKGAGRLRQKDLKDGGLVLFACVTAASAFFA